MSHYEPTIITMNRHLLLILITLIGAFVADARGNIFDKSGRRATRDDARIAATHDRNNVAVRHTQAQALKESGVIKGLTPMNGTPVRRTAEAEQSNTVKRLVKTESFSSEGFASTTEYTYNEYGYLDQENSGDNSGFSYAYEWLVPGKSWTKMTVNSSEGNVVRTYTRTYHSNGMVKTDRLDYADDADNWLVQTYDEEGYLIKVQDAYHTESFVKSPLTGQWYHAQTYPDYKEEYSVIQHGLAITYRRYRRVEDTDAMYLEEQNTQFYNEDGESVGHLQCHYSFDGTEVNKDWGDGYRIDVNRENGEIVTIEYQFDYDKFTLTPRSKRVESENVKTTPWSYAPDAIYYTREYDWDADAREWIQAYYRNFSWVNDHIIKYETKYRDEDPYTGYMTTVEPEDSDDDGLEYVWYDPATGMYAYSQWEDDYETYYIYNGDGSLQSKYRESRDLWSKWDGTAWVKCTGTITVYEDDDDWMILNFDDQGRLTRMDEYEDGEPEEYTLYYYYADGSVLETGYELVDDSDSYYKASEEYTSYFADGTEREWWEKYYDYDGNIDYAYRTISKSENLRQYFGWDYQNGGWISNGWYRSSDYEELPDGTITTIDYDVDDDGNETPTYKSVHREDAACQLYESYYWDAATSSWVGQGKNVSCNGEYEFPNIMPSWISPYVDFFEETPKYLPEGNNSIHYNNNRAYYWDASAGEWMLGYSDGIEVEIEGNKLTVKELEFADGKEGARSISETTVDADRRIVHRKVTQTYGPDHSMEFDTSYECDADGHLVQSVDKMQQTYLGSTTNDEMKTKYHYANVSVAGIEGIVADNDKTVVAVYNTNGIAVDKDNIAAGVFIVKYSDGTVGKIVKR